MKSPKDMQYNLDCKQKLLMIGNLFLLQIIYLLFVVSPIYFLIDELFIIKEKRYEDLTYGLAFFMMIILAPIVEEYLFRYHLRYSSFKSKFISNKNWDRVFPYLVYISAITFGLMHVFNFSNNDLLFYLLAPLITLSQLFGGFTLSFIRVRLSFSWAIIFHMLWNLFAFGTSLIPYTHKEENQHYTLDFKESSFIKNSDLKQIYINLHKDTIFEIKANQYYLQQLVDTIYGNEKYYTTESIVDMNFVSKKGYNKDSLLILFKDITTIRELK